jgi:hypothetical protein
MGILRNSNFDTPKISISVSHLLKGMLVSTFVWMMFDGKFAICLSYFLSISSFFHLECTNEKVKQAIQ